MKPTVFLVLVLGLIGCSSYPTKRQALEACREWEAGRIAIRTGVNPATGLRIFSNSRICEIEYETKQVLGLMNKTMEKRKWRKGLNEGKFEIVKNFRY